MSPPTRDQMPRWKRVPVWRLKETCGFSMYLPRAGLHDLVAAKASGAGSRACRGEEASVVGRDFVESAT
jgi:hypothetical protein